MPEGHTLHRLAAQLTETFGGQVVRSSSPQGRFAAGAARLDRLRLWGAEAWGKHLFVEIDGVSEAVHVHLGLYGGWTFIDHAPDTVPEAVGAVRWRLSGPAASPTTTADLRGPTACELLTPDQVAALIARLGPDPLRADADPERAWLRISRSRSLLATLLMDQAVVAGVGNVYRAEVLFRHGIDPNIEGRDVPRAVWEAVWADLVALMREGVRRGRIDTVRPEHEPEAMGREPRRDDHGGEVYVYRRTGQPCLVCRTPIATRTLSNRNLFWCPRCQGAGTLSR